MNTDLDVVPAEALRALAEPLRWRIVELLAVEELCVCHLVELLDAPQSLVSHHLRVLRKVGLVESERFRYWTYYRLRSDGLARVGRSISALIDAEPAGGRPRRPCC